MPKISIIIPVYNVQPYLRKCIRSILSQTFQDIEIILVNDGSTDTSIKIINDYADSDLRIKAITQLNHGVSAARNRGLEAARGEWIYFCDADDELFENALEVLVAQTEIPGVNFVMAGYETYDDKGNLIYSQPEREELNLSIEQCLENMFHPWFYCYQGYLWTKLFKRENIERIGLRFNENIYFNEDRLFCVQYLCGLTGCDEKSYGRYITTPIYRYFKRQDSAMASLEKQFNHKFVTDLDAFCIMMTTMQKSKMPKRLIRLCKEGLLNSIDWIAKRKKRFKVTDKELTEKLRYIKRHYIGMKDVIILRMKWLNKFGHLPRDIYEIIVNRLTPPHYHISD